MEARRFNALKKVLGNGVPRRGLMRAAIAASAGLGLSRLTGRAQAQDEEAGGSAVLRCVPCNCIGDVCECCLSGITGGGVVRTEVGDTNLVLFATKLADQATQEATGFVRWLDANIEGGLNMESVGPIAYDWPEGEEQQRFVRGIMAVSGQEPLPFVLEVFDAGPGKSGEDTVRIQVGSATTGDASGFGYEAAGTLVGGDLQLLDSVASVPVST